MARPKKRGLVGRPGVAIVAMVGIVWCLYGYSLAFTEGSHELVPLAEATIPACFSKAIMEQSRRRIDRPF